MTHFHGTAYKIRSFHTDTDLGIFLCQLLEFNLLQRFHLKKVILFFSSFCGDYISINKSLYLTKKKNLKLKTNYRNF